MTTVRREDVTVTREVEYIFYHHLQEPEEGRVFWTAVLDGRLESGESVHLSTAGPTYSEARAALDKLVSDEGWDWG